MLHVESEFDMKCDQRFFFKSSRELDKSKLNSEFIDEANGYSRSGRIDYSLIWCGHVSSYLIMFPNLGMIHTARFKMQH